MSVNPAAPTPATDPPENVVASSANQQGAPEDPADSPAEHPTSGLPDQGPGPNRSQRSASGETVTEDPGRGQPTVTTVDGEQPTPGAEQQRAPGPVRPGARATPETGGAAAGQGQTGEHPGRGGAGGQRHTDPTLKTAIRGAIRTLISTSTSPLVAGDNFFIFVTIFNPFEVPLRLQRISTFLPTEFLDVDRYEQRQALWEQFEQLRSSAEEYGVFISPWEFPFANKRPTSFWSKVGHAYARLLRQWDLPKEAEGPAIARDMIRIVSPAADTVLHAMAVASRDLREKVEAKGGQKLSKQETDEFHRRLKEMQKQLIAPPQPQDEAVKLLQPGNSTTRVFTVRSRKKIWFTPATYNLNIEVEYGLPREPNTDTFEPNTDTISSTLQVRSSLVSIGLGAALGAAIGWLVRCDNLAPDFSWAGFQRFLSLPVTMLLAMMTVLFLGRKKEAQPLVSVEDFWGGVVVGFLVAYGGLNVVGHAGEAAAGPTLPGH